MIELHVGLKENPYDIIICRGSLNDAGHELNLDRKVLVVTDNGVPPQYSRTVAAQCKNAVTVTVDSGEASKSISCFEMLMKTMLENNFSRHDAAVAVGGGVVGDLTGFAASCYMRGIDFYNIPTTLLSQVDSSVGGKTAVNLDGVKNIVGTFYQPKKVLIDPDVLKTLPPRQISNGLAEAIKMSVTSNAALFKMFENENPTENIEKVIAQSLEIKRDVVMSDEKEHGLRKILNFGHTIGHGIESAANLSEYLHGECVALGMLPMCSDTLRPRLIKALENAGLPTRADIDADKIMSAAIHDKKTDGDKIDIVYCEEPGKFEIRKIRCSELKNYIKAVYK